MNLSSLTGFFHPSARDWALEARVLRWMTLCWLLIGLMVLFSASYYLGVVQSNDGLFFFRRQLLWTVMGLVGFSCAVNFPLQHFLRITPIAFLVLLVLIFATHLPGIGVGVDEASRWIAVGPIRVQPSELMKPFLILQAALIFGRWHQLPPRDRLTWLGLFAVTLLGILVQPNLSTAALCGISLWLIALAAGISYFSLGFTALSGVGLAAVSISMVAYQRKRVLCFLDPFSEENRRDCAFQLIQSLLSIGSGGVWGEGFGLSQAKLARLPIPHTDFIFSVFAEEWGLIGAGVLLLWLAVYSLLALRVSFKTQHPVHRLVAIGAMVVLIGQALINIGVATGALPTTGLPLPFFSYGGSSIIASLLIAGLLIRVARESRGAEVVPFAPNLKLPVWDRSVPGLPALQNDRPLSPVPSPGTSSGLQHPSRRPQRHVRPLSMRQSTAGRKRPPPPGKIKKRPLLLPFRRRNQSQSSHNSRQSEAERRARQMRQRSNRSRRRPGGPQSR